MQESFRADTLSLLARRIDETQTTLDDRLREVKRLERLVADLRAEFNEITNIGAPIASLPNEVLTAIFKAGCALPHKETRKSRKRPNQPFELLVSLVSRRWRNVAISTPNLWTHIQFLPHQPIDLVTAYFSRSGILPLDIRADLRLRRRSLLSIGLFVKAVMPHIGRWRTMRLQSNHRRYLFAIFKHLRFGGAPLLECLEISFEGEDEEDEDEDEEDIDTITEEDRDTDDEDEETGNIEPVGNMGGRILMGGAPSLKILRLKDIELHCCEPLSSTLTTLHIHGVAGLWRKFRDILDNLPVLDRLVIYGRVIDDGDLRVSTRPAVLSALSSLHILHTLFDESQIALLKIISAPMLERLELEAILSKDIRRLFQGPEWTAAPRYPRLQSLTVSPRTWALGWQSWKILHRVFPTITELVLPDSLSFDFAKIHIDSVLYLGVSWWPNLQSLTLCCLGCDAESVHKLLSDRISQGYPLRKVCLRVIDGGGNEVSFLDVGDTYVELEQSGIEPDVDYNTWYRNDD